MDDPLKKAEYLKNLISDSQPHHFKMQWEGGKIPRGATINGVEIGWTQHGIVTGKNSQQLGTYSREVEFGGDTGNTQVMIISTSHTDVTPPPGGTVQKIDRTAERTL